MAEGAFLSDSQYREFADKQSPVVDPYDPKFTGPSSVDLRLGNRAYRYSLDKYILGQELTEADYVQEEFESLDLAPGKAAFVAIHERLTIPDDCLGFIFPRSSITRLGLSITPIYMNPGYTGRPPLTIVNHSSATVTLVPRVRIAQLVCGLLSGAPLKTYAGVAASKYKEEHGAPSLLHADADISAALDRVLKRVVPEHLLNEG